MGLVNFDESSIFVRKNTDKDQDISDSQSRLYGISKGVSKQINNIFGAFPYLAQSGISWNGFLSERLEKGLYNQLQGGRGVEIIICDALVALNLPGFHFLPTKEFDLSYKTDLISRVPYFLPTSTGKKLRTLSIGSQITVMEIPENMGSYNSHDRGKKKKKYSDKLSQVILMNQYLHIPQARKDLKKQYGKLTLPDIMCFVAVNGNIRKTFGSESGYLTEKFEKWRESHFHTPSLVENLEPHLRDDIYNIARFISTTQIYIFSKDFLHNKNMKSGRNFEQIIDENRSISYNPESQILECFLRGDGEVLCKISYLFTSDDIKKLQKKYTQNKIIQQI
ncbi:hypothetical protein KBB25_00965 [Candidatus Gracilibacteria bacterium]|nr:hypothetical protein [Candidatus Gracilibacteria bacterium]